FVWENFATESCSWARNSLEEVTEVLVPITANRSGRSPSRARLYSAGMSFRWVRSPGTPQITITRRSGGRDRTTAGPAPAWTSIWVPSMRFATLNQRRAGVKTKARLPRGLPLADAVERPVGAEGDLGVARGQAGAEDLARRGVHLVPGHDVLVGLRVHDDGLAGFEDDVGEAAVRDRGGRGRGPEPDPPEGLAAGGTVGAQQC